MTYGAGRRIVGWVSAFLVVLVFFGLVLGVGLRADLAGAAWTGTPVPAGTDGAICNIQSEFSGPDSDAAGGAPYVYVASWALAFSCQVAIPTGRGDGWGC